MFAGHDEFVALRDGTDEVVVRLRCAVRDDVDAIVAVEAHSNVRFAAAGHPELLEARMPDDFAVRAIDHHAILVAVVDGRVIGFLQVTRLHRERCIGQVSVVPEFGRRGLGGALMASAVLRARSDAEPSIVLSTLADVPWNAPWYAQQGFQIVPEESWSPPMRALAADRAAAGTERETLVFMRLTLTPSPHSRHHR